ncbi:MAG: tetratricopeptide repeat protein, partial [Myxococcota bacterium]
KLETPNFIIYHSSRIKPKNVKFIALQAEFYRQELNRFFQHSYPGKVKIFLFDSIQQKRRLFGAHSVEVAKPWLSEIYITSRGLIHSSLKHELAHLWASMYGDDYFGISFVDAFGVFALPNPGMIEGIAVAASFYSDGMSFHQKAKILHNLKIAVPIRKIFSPEFFASSSARAYTQAGSFLRYLYEQRGPEKLFELFANGGVFAEVYETSPEKLEKDYLNFLKTIKVDEEIMAVMKAVFSHPPVHKSRCVHQVAREVQKARLAFGEKKFGKAIKLFQKAIDYDPKSLYLKMYYLQAAQAGKYYKEAFAKARQIIGSSNDNPQLKARAVLTLVEIYWFRKEISLARKTLKKLEGITLSRDLKRQKVLFNLILEMAPARRKHFRNIFLKSGKPVEIAAKLEKTAAFFPLAKYLAASLLLNSGEWSEAAAVFRQVDPGNLPDSDFRCEFYRRFTLASLLVINLKQARKFLAKYQECPQSYSNLLNKRFLDYMEENKNDIKLK